MPHCKPCKETSGYITQGSEQDERKIYFFLQGEKKKCGFQPTIVFLHGLGSDHRLWKCQQEALCEDYQTLSIDLRGFGKSSALLQDTYSYEMFAYDLKVVLDALQITDIVLVGVDLGANIAVSFSATYPSYVVKLVLSGVNPLLTARTRAQQLLRPSPAAWEFAQYTNDELTSLYQAINTNYPLFVQQYVDAMYTDMCTNLKSLVDYSISVMPPAPLLLKMLGSGNPQSFVFEDLFPTLFDANSILNLMQIPILLVTGTTVSSRQQGAVGTTFTRLTPTDVVLYEFLAKSMYSNVTDTCRYNEMLRQFICLNLKPEKCDICPIEVCPPCSDPFDNSFFDSSCCDSTESFSWPCDDFNRPCGTSWSNW
jgi:pimeloyl-ACP methyl ester carboxylesterase